MNKYIAFSIIFFSQISFACIVPPKQIMRAPETLINEASGIVVVEAIFAHNQKEKCQLKTIEVLKGNANSVIGISCRLPEAGDWMTDFNGHSLNSFWSGNGRLGINGDCTIIAPAFSISKQYLVFLGISPDVKQYEEVSNAHDAWLMFVKKKLDSSRK